MSHPQPASSLPVRPSRRPALRSWGALLGLSALLASCASTGTPPAPTTPTATGMQLNGTRVLGPSQVQFGVTPLNGTQTATGTLSNPAVTFTTAGVSGTVSVCGQVSVQNTVTAAVTLDATGSMSSTDPDVKRRAAAKAFVARMTGDSQAAVLSFEASSAPSAGLIGSRLHQDLTSDQTALNRAIDNATYASGTTNFYDAVVDAVKVASRAGRPSPIVLALTDGIDNRSSHSPDDAIAAAKAAGVPVYAIGLDATGTLDFTQMERIASETGGLFRSNIAAGDLDAYFSQLYNAFTAQGCLELNLAAAPAPGTTVAGTLSVDVTDYGKATSRLSVPFSYAVRDTSGPN